MSESEAVSFAQAGDSNAFGVLYDLHRQRVFLNCLKLLRNKEEAEDLTQEVFLHMFEKIAQFQGRSTFATWLHRLTTNKVLDYLSHQKHKPMSNLCDVVAPEERFSPPNQLAQLELLEAMNSLTSTQRFMVEGEISGKSCNNKHSETYHLRSAQKKLREHFA